jgi:arsenate reductase
MLFLQYPPCSTCKKAKAFLDAQGVSYTARHIKEENPSYEELKAWVEMSGLPLKKFFNTSGLLYKSMNLKEKLPTMTEEEQLKLLASDGMLVKRPILVTEKTVLTGFREEAWKEALG